ncbi:ribokinase [Brachybacterium hainanense]|uniref:Ribokinase n=1 Tax=Brachybacterium hainanense TaxID=1541174 RepID=A0ABV6R883_9MICO
MARPCSSVPAILVVGSINVDLLVRVDRHPCPGETVPGEGGELLPGGKGANQAVAAARLGGRVAMLGAVGSDAAAATALSALRDSGAATEQVLALPGPTGQAIVTVAADGENAIIVIPGANARVDGDRVRSCASLIASAGIVVSQGEIPASGIEALAPLVRGRFLLNPAPVIPLPAEVLRAADPLVVNEHEAGLVLAGLGVPAADIPAAPQGMLRALRGQGIRAAVLTLGAQGALVSDGTGTWHVPAARVEAVDTTGAGDAFIGALAVELSRGKDLVEAARLACRVGAAAATSAGAQPSYPRAGDPLPELAGEVTALPEA